MKVEYSVEQGGIKEWKYILHTLLHGNKRILGKKGIKIDVRISERIRIRIR